jgi:hypothetical protein
MTALPQTALEFCRECLGWDDVREDGIGLYVYSHAERSRLLHYGDLNTVMAAVRGWCDQNEAGVEIGYYGYILGSWDVIASTPASSETHQSHNLSHALLSACLEAHRKLKAAT